jgi:hypothetical protein
MLLSLHNFNFYFSETLLGLNDIKDDDTSTDAGSSNGDNVIGTSGMVDPSSVLVSLTVSTKHVVCFNDGKLKLPS